MTVSEVMKNSCLGIIIAYGKDKAELNNSEARDVQDYILKEIGVMADDRDIKIFYKSFAAEYWKTHSRVPPRREEYMGVVHGS